MAERPGHPSAARPAPSKTGGAAQHQQLHSRIRTRFVPRVGAVSKKWIWNSRTPVTATSIAIIDWAACLAT
jgi:hypothetical protein